MDAGVLTMKMQQLACGLVFLAACGKPGNEGPPVPGKRELHVVFGKPMYMDLKARSFNSGGIGDLTPLRIFTSLETLDLSNNPIKDIGPLRGLKKLKRLDLSNTFVQDLSPLNEHPELLYLNILGTNVSDISGLPASLRLLQVDRNLPAGELDGFRKSHPECQIQFTDGLERPPGEVGPVGDARKVKY